MEKNQILEAYKKYCLEKGQKPVSIYAFCNTIGCNENDFYNHFNSIEAVEKEVWLSIFTSTVEQLKQDEVYQQYSAKEKLLAFYYLWVQRLKENRSYILLQKSTFKITDLPNNQLSLFRKAFEEYANEIVKAGYESGEVKERKFISDQYSKGFWLQALFVLNYWISDTSVKFEMTDAAIEKAVELSFNMIASNTIDSLLDFGKFIFASK